MSFFEAPEEGPATPREPKPQSFEQKLEIWLEEDPIGQKIGKLMDKFVEIPDEKFNRGMEIAVVLGFALAQRRRAKKAFDKYDAGQKLSFQDYEAILRHVSLVVFAASAAAKRRHGIIRNKKDDE